MNLSRRGMLAAAVSAFATKAVAGPAGRLARARSTGGGGGGSGSPTVSGTGREQELLTAVPAGFPGSPWTYTYRWFANGVLIPRSFRKDLTPFSIHSEKLISVEVTAHYFDTATNIASTVVGTSPAIGPIEAVVGTLVSSSAALDAAFTDACQSPGVPNTIRRITLADGVDFGSAHAFNGGPPVGSRVVLRPQTTTGAKARMRNSFMTSLKRVTFDNIDVGDETGAHIACFSINAGQPAQDVWWINCHGYGKPLNDAKSAVYNSAAASPKGRFITGSGGLGQDCRVEGNDIHDLESGIKPTGGMVGAHRHRIEGNYLRKIYTDAISIGFDLTNPTIGGSISLNRITNRICLASDYGNPHGDAVQFFATGGDDSSVPARDIDLLGNVVWTAPTDRGNYQGLLLAADIGRLSCFKVNILRVSDFGDSQSLSSTCFDACYVTASIALRATPSVTPTELGTISTQRSYSINALRSYIGDCIANSINAGTGGFTERNVIVAPDATAYGGLLDGPTFAPTTFAELFAQYEFKAGTPREPLRQLIDYENQMYDVTMEVPWFPVKNILDAEPGVPISSAWVPLMGGGPHQPYICLAGTEVRSADDDQGTNASNWSPAGGFMDERRYYQMRRTSSGTVSGSVACGVIIRGITRSFTITTRTVLQLHRVANRGTAFSKLVGTIPTLNAQKKALWMARYRMAGANKSSKFIYAAASWGLTTDAAGALAHRYVTSGTISASEAVAIDYDLHSEAWSMDLSKTLTEDYWRWQRDNSPVDTGHPTPAANKSFNPAAAGSMQDLVIGASAAGQDLTNFEMEMFWFHCWPAGVEIPDIRDPNVFNLFNADNLGPRGQGPLGGTIPYIYWEGPVDQWNDPVNGLPNKGQWPIALVRQTGATGIITNGGSGYTSAAGGTFTYNLPMTGGSGTGAICTVWASYGKVSICTVTTIGTGYVDGDILTAAAPGGSGFEFTVQNTYVAAN
jgi:hypothetical protein